MNNLRFQFFFTLSVAILCALFPDVSFAYTAKEGNVTATFAPYFYQTRFQETDSGAKSPLLGGFGLIILGDANEKGSLEIGLFHTDKVYLREQSAKYIAQQVKLLQITMGYRWWLSQVWSTSLTFSSSYPMGDPTIVHNDFTSGTRPTTSAEDLTEYGVDLSVQYEFWQKDRWGAITDIRYHHSFTSKTREYGDHQGILVGLRYLIQEGN